MNNEAIRDTAESEQKSLSLQFLLLPCFERLVRLELLDYPLRIDRDCEPRLLDLRHLRLCVSSNAALVESAFSWWGRTAPSVTSFRYDVSIGSSDYTPSAVPRLSLSHNLLQTFPLLTELELNGIMLESGWWDGVAHLPHLQRLCLTLDQLHLSQLQRCAELLGSGSEAFPLLSEVKVRTTQVYTSRSEQQVLVLRDLEARALQARP